MAFIALALASIRVPVVPSVDGQPLGLSYYKERRYRARTAARIVREIRNEAARLEAEIADLETQIMDQLSAEDADSPEARPQVMLDMLRDRLDAVGSQVFYFTRAARPPSLPGPWTRWRGLRTDWLWSRRTHLIQWDILAVEIGVLLLLAGGAMTWVARRERRRKAELAA